MLNVNVSGNIGSDATVKEAGGTSVCNFSLAAKVGYGQSEQTLWLDCQVWGKRAETALVDMLKKGAGVHVSGELFTKEYNGQTRLKVKVADVNILKKAENGSGGSGPAQAAGRQQRPASSGPSPDQKKAAGDFQAPNQAPAAGPRNVSEDDFDDDIPF